MSRFLLSLFVLIVFCSVATAQAEKSTTATPPNVVMIFTDDWGYGDLGKFGALNDVKTPHLDALADQGILFTDAYITAPQCSPSRAGLLTGRYQQRFNFDSIPNGPLPRTEVTVADRIKSAGYRTGMVGKWHLEPNAVCFDWAKKHCPEQIVNRRVRVPFELGLPYYPQARGFNEFFKGELNTYWANFDLDGQNLAAAGEWVQDERFRIDIQTEAGLAFIDRNAKRPFFLYLAYYAPHVPLEASEKYLSRFPGDMPERRRTGLAMMNAVDEGVGRLVKRLKEQGIYENTLIMFTSDNGAPLGAQTGKPMNDVLPVGKAGPAWDGSRNDPLTGEKGMLAEGGIRVPMIWSWPGRLPAGKTVSEPVISLDMTATALAAAGLPLAKQLDGEDLLPWLTGEASAPARPLYWRFWNQAAIRNGNWKFLQTGDGREFLFQIEQDKEERRNLLSEHPEHAAQLRADLAAWCDELDPPGLPDRPLNIQEKGWYEHFFSATTEGDE
ncbi:sulfatase [Rubinisphaera sp. JC750]|uniref:sulfatase family protein n=1 Tax=Rubinisphaera sp. JC750 TaxID=2898658 RepID=UPI001F00F21A|nr:sulfatase-like hydrolase/transferase [Rubinisphaera sp. JC750]